MLKLFMTKNSKIIEQLMLAAIIGVASIGVSFIGQMSQTIQTMSISVQELNIKVSGAFDSLKDHEIRLRTIESNKRE
jgi:hypothetical protein